MKNIKQTEIELWYSDAYDSLHIINKTKLFDFQIYKSKWDKKWYRSQLLNFQTLTLKALNFKKIGEL